MENMRNYGFFMIKRNKIVNDSSVQNTELMLVHNYGLFLGNSYRVSGLVVSKLQQ